MAVIIAYFGRIVKFCGIIGMVNDMKDFFLEYLDKIIAIAVIIVACIIVNVIIDKIIDRTIKRRKKKNVTTILVFIKGIKRVVISCLCVLICLFQFESISALSVTLLSGVGIGSIVLGLAAQESLKNFFGSFSLVLGSAYEVGDFIECIDKGVSGIVEDITMRHTVIKTINNRRVIIPNSEMNKYTIENFNYCDNENVKLVDFSISYESDADKAMDIIKKEMEKLYHPNPNGKNKSVEFPKVRMASWDDSGVTIRAWVWGSDNGNTFENTYKLYYEVKKKFEKNGIEIPYPHMVNFIKNMK